MPQTSTHPDAIAVLERDHRAVEQLFRRFERARGPAERGRLAQRMVRELSVHAALEEQLVYPALRRRLEGHEGPVLRALEEHHFTKLALSEIEAMDASEERFAPKVLVLIDAMRRHIAEERETLFPAARRTFSAQELHALAESLERARGVAPTRPHPAAPDEPPANAIANAGAAAYDRSRDALERGLVRALDRSRGMVEEALRRGEAVARRARQRLGRGIERAGREVRTP